MLLLPLFVARSVYLCVCLCMCALVFSKLAKSIKISASWLNNGGSMCGVQLINHNDAENNDKRMGDAMLPIVMQFMVMMM